jgi:hypothetical protein
LSLLDSVVQARRLGQRWFHASLSETMGKVRQWTVGCRKERAVVKAAAGDTMMPYGSANVERLPLAGARSSRELSCVCTLPDDQLRCTCAYCVCSVQSLCNARVCGCAEARKLWLGLGGTLKMCGCSADRVLANQWETVQERLYRGRGVSVGVGVGEATRSHGCKQPVWIIQGLYVTCQRKLHLLCGGRLLSA